jgi:hypothetical protein
MTASARLQMRELIRRNIEGRGLHIYCVAGGSIPRTAYTIGVSEVTGHEFVLAGAATFSNDQAGRLLNFIGLRSRERKLDVDENLNVPDIGHVAFRACDQSWTRAIMLGVYDYYSVDQITAYQVVPDEEHWTLDIPNMLIPWSASQAPAWRWLHETWTFDVPSDSLATTNLAALKGSPITEVARWETKQWEMFAGAGPDVRAEDVRTVSLGTLFGIDASLVSATTLQIGQGIWRAGPTDPWHYWGKIH